MSSSSIAFEVDCSFGEWPNGIPTDKFVSLIGRVPECLADFIEAWVCAGYGVRVCNGEFKNLLIAILSISELWQKDPGIVDYVTGERNEEIIDRRVDSLFGKAHFQHDILDPDWFARQVFRELHGARPLRP